MAVDVSKSSGHLSFYGNTTGSLKLQEGTSLNNGSPYVAFDAVNNSIQAVYGGGYNGNMGSVKGASLIMNNTQTGGWNSDSGLPHNICIPFITVSSENGYYGVLFDDHYRGAVIKTYDNGISYESKSNSPISYYFVNGESIDDVIANYTYLTGRAKMPPYWVLGYITSRYGYQSKDEANEAITKIKALDIPLDGIVLDLFWEGKDPSGMGNLDWDTEKFNNPGEILSEWKNKGVHTTLITEPFFTSNCKNWTQLTGSDYLADSDVSNMSWLMSNHVGLLDVTNPDAISWMFEFYKARTQEGVDGWWLDLGEPEMHDNDSKHLGGTVDEVHNEFGQIWLEGISKGLEENFSDRRHFLMPRSGTSGMQRFSAFPWTGDIQRSWKGLQAQIPALINMSMSGVSFVGSDVGGFTNGDLNPELYLRWVQFGALSPLLRTHAIDNSINNTYMKPEPYHEDYTEVLPYVRKAINLRYRMIPYIYTLAYENSAFGYPMARPAGALDFNKVNLADNKDSYLWGRDIFVAPMLNSGTSRQITFPEGEWIDMNAVLKATSSESGAQSSSEDMLNSGSDIPVYTGHSIVNYQCSQAEIPFFIRRGSFIPMFTKESNIGNTSELKYDELTVYHYFGDDASNSVYESILYEDDRKSPTSIEDNNYCLLHFTENNVEGDLYNVEIRPEVMNNADFIPETRTIHLYCFGYKGMDIDGLKVTLTDALTEVADENSHIARSKHVPGLRFGENSGDSEDVTDLFNQAVHESLESAKSSDSHAIYLDKDRQMLYVKVNAIPSTSHVKLEMGSIPTAVGSVMSESGLYLAYANGSLNYSVSENASSASIEIFSIDGRIIASYNPYKNDGFVHSIGVEELSGFCIGRISAKDAHGNSCSKQIKFIAK